MTLQLVHVPHRTHTVAQDSDVWAMRAEPHIMARARRMFPEGKRSSDGDLVLTANDEHARDLAWFRLRYPLVMTPAHERILIDAEARHQDRENTLGAILNDGYRLAPLNLDTAGMTARDYQLTFADVARVSRRMVLADEVGLGKTISAGLLFAEPDALPAVIVVQTNLPRQWTQRMAQLWPMLTAHTVRSRRVYDPAMYMQGARPDLLIVPYSRLSGWADYLQGNTQTVIFDECAELRHGTNTDKGRAAAQITRDATYVIGLSATPIHNLGGEAWNVFNIVAPGALGTRDEFLREYGGTSATGKERLAKPRELGSYLRRQGLMLRRTKADVGREMAEPLVSIEHVDSDAAAFADVRADVVALAERILDRDTSAKDRFLLGGQIDFKLRQATGIAKAPYVADFVRLLLETNKRVVLYGWHRACYDIWLDRLAKFNPVMITGSETTKQKDASFDAFTAPLDAPGASRLLLVSLRSGAGLDGLQHVCSTVVIGELDWSPAQIEQCIGRVDRDGQTELVSVFYLVADDGSDPVLAESIEVKKQQATQIVDPDAAAFTAAAVDTDRALRLAAAILRRPIPERTDHG